MALKARVGGDEFAALDPGLQPLYRKSESGEYLLDAEGVEDVRGLKSALEAQKEQARKYRELAQQYEGLDPAAARAALQKLHEYEDKQLLDAGKVEELLAKRTERMRADFEAAQKALQQQTEKLQGENKTLGDKLAEVLIDSGLTQAAQKAGVRQTALPDVILRGRLVWKLQEGKPLPVRDDGSLLYGKKPPEPMSMDEWMASLASDAPHLFEPSRGAGTPQGSGPVVRAGVLVMSRDEARDPTIYRARKEEAARVGAELRVAE